MLIVNPSSLPSILIKRYKDIAIGNPKLAIKLTISSSIFITPIFKYANTSFLILFNYNIYNLYFNAYKIYLSIKQTLIRDIIC